MGQIKPERFLELEAEGKTRARDATRRTRRESLWSFFSTNITAAELCRKHNVSPATFQDWRDMFLHGSKQALLNRGDAAKSHAREVENLKRIIGEITVTNNILKTLEGAKQ